MTPEGQNQVRVGFIGLGDIGGAMATRIVGAGFPTVLWARRPEVLASFTAENVVTAPNPAELAAGADVVGVCVWADRDVRDVLLRDDGLLAGARPGTIIAIHSTVLPATCRELASVAGDRGVVVVDAPVSGGREGALAGSLVVAVGGEDAAVERCRPVFASFGDPVVHLGPVGSGQFAKLVNNTLLAANLAIADDALSLGRSVGIEPEAMAQVLRHGSGKSYALEVAVAARASADIRSHARPSFEKDVRNLVAEAAPQECATWAQLLAEAAAQAVKRLGDPPPGWAD